METYDRLIQPITQTNPVGEDIRNSANSLPLYMQLKANRLQLRSEENKQLNEGNTLIFNMQGWEGVCSVATDLLTNYSKDIEIAALLLEAKVRLEGFAGLSQGLSIINELIIKYGSDLFPSIEPKDLNQKFTALAALSGDSVPGVLIAPLYFCDLIKDSKNKTYNGWEIKSLLQQSSKNLPENITKSFLEKSEHISKMINDINGDYLLKVDEQLTDCSLNFDSLNTTLASFDLQALNMRNLQKALAYFSSLITSILEIRNSQTSTVVEDNYDIKAAGSGNTNSDKSSVLAINPEKLNYEDAINLLRVLVDFFRDTEPHSPVSYVLERALKWTALPLPELLTKMLSTEARREFCGITGTPFMLNNEKSDYKEEEDFNEEENS